MSLMNDVLKKIDQQSKVNIPHKPPEFVQQGSGDAWYKKPLFWIGLLLSCLLAITLIWAYVAYAKQTPEQKSNPLPHSDTLAKDAPAPISQLDAEPAQALAQQTPQSVQEGSDTSVVKPLIQFTTQQQQQFLYHKAYQAALDHQWDQVAALLQNSKLPLAVQQAPYKQVATALFKQKRYDTAILAAKRGLSVQQDSELYMLIAQSYLQQNMLVEAYDILVSHRPNLELHPQYYGLLANTQLQLKHYKDAQQSYHQLATAFPDESRWWFGLAMSAQHNKDKKLAYHAYQQALDLGHMKQGIRKYIQDQLKTLQA